MDIEQFIQMCTCSISSDNTYKQCLSLNWLTLIFDTIYEYQSFWTHITGFGRSPDFFSLVTFVVALLHVTLLVDLSARTHYLHCFMILPWYLNSFVIIWKHLFSDRPAGPHYRDCLGQGWSSTSCIEFWLWWHRLGHGPAMGSKMATDCLCQMRNF